MRIDFSNFLMVCTRTRFRSSVNLCNISLAEIFRTSNKMHPIAISQHHKMCICHYFYIISHTFGTFVLSATATSRTNFTASFTWLLSYIRFLLRVTKFARMGKLCSISKLHQSFFAILKFVFRKYNKLYFLHVQ